MRHPNDYGHVGRILPVRTTPPEFSIDGIAEWDPAYETPLSRHAREDAELLESRAKKGIPVLRPDLFPEYFWNTLAIQMQAEFVARSNFGEEDGGGKKALELLAIEANQAGFKPYGGPGERGKGLPSASRPDSMIGTIELMRPYDVWVAIEESGKKEPCLPLPPEDSENLRLVLTGREGSLMLLVIGDQDLARYVSGDEPCPVIIRGSRGYVTIRGEAQGYAGQGRFGAAANRIGRLGYFAGVSPMANPVGIAAVIAPLEDALG